MRAFLASLIFVGIVFVAAAEQPGAEILVQVSLTSGLAHHEAKAVWDQMKVGDALTLVRETDNAHDTNAVRVDWNNHTLGYVPRTDNAALARQLDRGNRLAARITKLTLYRNHRKKLEFEVFAALDRQ